MRAITADSFPGLVDSPDPPLQAGTAVIKVVYAGVNRADLLQVSGAYATTADSSPILGLEAAGIVHAVGSPEDRARIGRPVAALLGGGGYADFVTVPEGQLFFLDDAAPVLTGIPATPADGVSPDPSSLSPFAAAAAFPETLCTAYFNLVDLAQLRTGETVLIHGGSGGVGHVAIQLARLLGARVITTCGSASKAEFCRALGADVAIDYHDDVVEAVLDATDGKGVDVILDVLGAGGLPSNLAMLAMGGRIAVVGLQKGRRGELDFVRLMEKRATIVGARLRDLALDTKARLVSESAPYISQLRIHVDAVVPFDDAGRAHQLMDAPSTKGKVILEL